MEDRKWTGGPNLAENGGPENAGPTELYLHTLYSNLVLHFPVLHFPPSDLPIIVVLHFSVITFTPIVLHWSSFFRSSIFSQPHGFHAEIHQSQSIRLRKDV